MQTVSDLAEWRRLRAGIRGSVGFIPTMGDLHAGHISLVQRARMENDVVVVSIFVNPAQFNDPTDFEKYKRTLPQDCALLQDAGAHYLLAPSAPDMYPDGYEVQVCETEISKNLEGPLRPGHFTGMLTVVLKLLNLVQADRAYFGEKDFQQLLLVQKMAAAFFLPTKIIPCETIRAPSGLALSSRNSRLPPERLEVAALLYHLLSSPRSDAEVKQELNAVGFETEYVESRWNRRLAAAWLGGVRLIDNVLQTQGE
jgi:pantoate--beta-alanine ligase